jgi:hypothetical protein
MVSVTAIKAVSSFSDGLKHSSRAFIQLFVEKIKQAESVTAGWIIALFG